MRISLARFLPVALVAATVGLLPGCASYRLGTPAPATISSIYIAPARNDAGLTQATALVTAALREAFARDNRLTLASSAAGADATLTVTLRDYGRTATTVRPGDTGLARKFALTVRATATLEPSTSGDPALFTDRPLAVTRQIFTDDGQNPAEYQALPLLAEQLADRALHAVLDVW